MNAIAEKNLLVRDPDGNWYSIPPGLKGEFDSLKQAAMDEDFADDEWQIVDNVFAETFNKYLKVD